MWDILLARGIGPRPAIGNRVDPVVVGQVAALSPIVDGDAGVLARVAWFRVRAKRPFPELRKVGFGDAVGDLVEDALLLHVAAVTGDERRVDGAALVAADVQDAAGREVVAPVDRVPGIERPGNVAGRHAVGELGIEQDVLDRHVVILVVEENQILPIS